MKTQDKLKKVKIVCERCRGKFVLKLPKITGAVSVSHPALKHLKGSGTEITLCPECHKEFDEMAPEE